MLKTTAILDFAIVSMIYRSTISGLISTDRIPEKQTDHFDKRLNRLVLKDPVME